jgi:hypothetical protein
MRPSQTKQIPWPESVSELYRPSDRRLSAELMPAFPDRRCRLVSATVPQGRIPGFLDQLYVSISVLKWKHIPPKYL